MNYFAHALPFLDRPHFLAGTAMPDWLAVADRSLRPRPRRAEAGRNDADRCTAEVAAGVLQHFHDDTRFHATKAFAETSLQLTVCARDALGKETGLRPAFLGHLLVEPLLDAALIAEAPERLTEFPDSCRWRPGGLPEGRQARRRVVASAASESPCR